MNPLLLGFAAALFFLLRKKPTAATTTTTAPGSGTSFAVPLGPPIPTNQPGGAGTPQGQQVVLLNAILANKLPCMDPAGKARVFDIKQMEKELNRLQGLLNDESQRAQPDEAYILQISQDYELVNRAMKAAAVIHLQKCQKYFDDFSKRPGSNTGQTSITTATNVRQAP
jgi:hypothetical protein